jgi:hypothetical protein
VLRVGDRPAKGVVDNMEDGLIPQRRGPIEPAPGHQHASGRPGIVTAVAQEEHIAQRCLVLAAARDARTGGGGFQRQAAANGTPARTRQSSMASAAPARNAASSLSVTGASMRAQPGNGRPPIS